MASAIFDASRKTASGGPVTVVVRRLADVAVVAVAAGAEMLAWSQDSALRAGGSLPVFIVPVMIIAVYTGLLLRNRHPLGIYGVMWLFSLSGLLLPGFNPFVGLLIALFTVAACETVRVAVTALVLATIPMAVGAFNGAAYLVNSPVSFEVRFAGQMGLSLVLTIAAFAAGRVACNIRRRAEEQRELRAAEAIRSERLRLARELHDSVAHAVSAMLLQAAGAQTLLSADPDPKLSQTLKVIETTGVQAMSELRRLLGLLRADEDSLTDRATMPTLEQIDDLLMLARSLNIETELVEEGPRHHLTPQVSHVAYRILQEALTNTAKHAGGHPSSLIRLQWSPWQLKITVQDHTQASPANPLNAAQLSSGNGLRGLEERASEVGGSVHAQPLPDGYLVTAHLPTISRAVWPIGEPAAVTKGAR